MPTLVFGPAIGLDINAYRGDDFKAYMQFKRNGVEEDLSTSEHRMQIRNGATLINEISTDLSSQGVIRVETLDPGSSGSLVLEIPRSRMLNLPAGVFQYDIEQKYPDGTVRTRVRGSFIITDDITKPLA